RCSRLLVDPRGIERDDRIRYLRRTGVAVDPAAAWRGVAGPKGLPRETATRLTNALKKGCDSNAFRDQMTRRGFRPVWRSTTEFAAFMEVEDKRLGAVVQTAGMAKA
ncbi:MAG: hypothetical protein EHM89_17245, partial [Acidobacteria bacterium]